MNDRIFFDTNVLVYAFDRAEPEKGAVARRLIHDCGAQGKVVLSTQVLQEFYVAVTKVGKSILPRGEAEMIVNDLAEFPLLQVDRTLISLAMRRHQAGVFSFWDSLIVEAALRSGCAQLLTEDMHDGLKIDSLTIRNPFVAPVSATTSTSPGRSA